MNIHEVLEKSFERLKTFDAGKFLTPLKYANEGALLDALNRRAPGEDCLNYQWWPCFIDELKPKQIVELGSAMGVGDICMLQAEYQDFKLYGITLEEGGLEFSYVEKDKYPNFFPIVGDDLDLSVWPKDLDLSKTDCWYIDSLHTEEQLRKEIELYKQFFAPGVPIVFDDIFQNPGMARVWHDLENLLPLKEKIDLTPYGLHFTGYGLIQLKD